MGDWLRTFKSLVYRFSKTGSGEKKNNAKKKKLALNIRKLLNLKTLQIKYLMISAKSFKKKEKSYKVNSNIYKQKASYRFYRFGFSKLHKILTKKDYTCIQDKIESKIYLNLRNSIYMQDMFPINISLFPCKIAHPFQTAECFVRWTAQYLERVPSFRELWKKVLFEKRYLEKRVKKQNEMAK